MCSFFNLHQCITWLIHLHPAQEPLGLPKKGSWQQCRVFELVGCLPSSLGKHDLVSVWLPLCLEELPNLRLDFTANHRPASDLKHHWCNSLLVAQELQMCTLLDSLHLSKPFILNSQQTSTEMEPYKIQKSPSFCRVHVRLPVETSVAPTCRGHQVSICSLLFLLLNPLPTPCNPIS